MCNPKPGVTTCDRWKGDRTNGRTDSNCLNSVGVITLYSVLSSAYQVHRCMCDDVDTQCISVTTQKYITCACHPWQRCIVQENIIRAGNCMINIQSNNSMWIYLINDFINQCLFQYFIKPSPSRKLFLCHHILR